MRQKIPICLQFKTPYEENSSKKKTSCKCDQKCCESKKFGDTQENKRHMANHASKISGDYKYACKPCQFGTNKTFNWNRHVKRPAHLNKIKVIFIYINMF